ncbi:MAG: hypothetical protein ACREJO_13600 [Phycisphaerales bacterium]
MTFRAIVKDGLIVVNTHGALADGTTVEILVPGGTSKRRGTKKKSSSTTKKPAPRRTKGGQTPGFGIWADRADLGTSDQAVDRLRASTRRRRVD